MVKSTERPRRAPVGRASERQKRSDLICDRKTSHPPASSSSPLPSTANLHHLRINLLHPPSLASIPSLPPRSSTSSSLLSSVVHEPPRALNLFLQLSIRAFASDIVLASSPFFFSFFPLPISFHSFARVFSSGFINRFDFLGLLFVAHSVSRASFNDFRFILLRVCSISFLRFRYFLSSSYTLIYILDINHYSG